MAIFDLFCGPQRKNLICWIKNVNKTSCSELPLKPLRVMEAAKDFE